jgi:hypothetical protein
MNLFVMSALFFAVLQADKPRLEMVGIVDADGARTPIVAPVVYHVFSGEPLSVELSLEAALGGSLDLRADFIQIAQSLAAPLAEKVMLAEGIAFNGVTCRKITVTLPLPKVTRETKILVRFQIKSAEKWQAAGDATFMVYPRDLLQEEIRNAIGPIHPLLIGSDTRLGDFLTKAEIKFDRCGGSLPEFPETNRLYVGNAGADEVSRWLEAHPRWNGSLMLFFEEEPGQLPGVFSDIKGGARVIKVTLPILPGLSTDPVAQKTLVAIFNSINTRPIP